MDAKTLNNIKVYATYFVTIFSPALTTLMASLGSVYHWSQVTNVIAAVGALTTFIGAIAQINVVRENNAIAQNNADAQANDVKQNNSTEVK